jgi:hypothetical protein
MPYHAMASGSHLHGLHRLLAYRNQDGTLVEKNCGLAAAATALHHKHLYSKHNLTHLEDEYPPDILFGLFGTSKSRVCEILSAYGCRWREVRGETALKHALRNKHLVLVMLSIPTRGILPAGHWMAAFAYDKQCVHLTNYHRHKDQMSWSLFREGWGSTLSAFIYMQKTGIAIL